MSFLVTFDDTVLSRSVMQIIHTWLCPHHLDASRLSHHMDLTGFFMPLCGQSCSGTTVVQQLPHRSHARGSTLS